MQLKLVEETESGAPIKPDLAAKQTDSHRIYSRVSNRSTGTRKKPNQKSKWHAIFFAVLLKVLHEFGLR